MIAIPNMNKPQNCQECPAHTFNYGYIPDHDGCRILKRAFNIDKLGINPLDEVLPDCPLIEIADDVWENEKYKLIRMTEEARINKAMAERRNDD